MNYLKITKQIPVYELGQSIFFIDQDGLVAEETIISVTTVKSLTGSRTDGKKYCDVRNNKYYRDNDRINYSIDGRVKTSFQQSDNDSFFMRTYPSRELLIENLKNQLDV